jgi:steroid delta-isomerase-like uncharacterized protein
MENDEMTTTTDMLKATARRFLDAVDRRDWSSTKELVALNCRARVGGQSLDRDAWLGMGQMFAAAFPDGKHEIEDVIAEGDRVVVRGVWRGTHTGEFQGVPASGRRVCIDMIVIDRFAEGRIVEHFVQLDALGMMQQIGAIPSR